MRIPWNHSRSLSLHPKKKHTWRHIKRGDEGAKDILIERNLRLVAHVVKKYQGLHEEQDDLLSIGTIGLIRRDDL